MANVVKGNGSSPMNGLIDIMNNHDITSGTYMKVTFRNTTGGGSANTTNGTLYDTPPADVGNAGYFRMGKSSISGEDVVR
jgi:hypothetical protein